MVFFSSRISPFDVDGDLARQIAARDRRRDLGDVAHLTGQVRGHRVHVVGQILPDAGDARNLRLATQLPFGPHLARHPAHLRGEPVQLIDHRVDGVLQLGDLAADVDGDLARQIAPGDRRRHLRDVPHLIGQVRGHRVHVVGQILPGPGDTRDLRLAAELALGAHLARHPAHLRGEPVELIDHRVDGVLQLENLPFDVDGDLARQIAARDRRGHLGDVAHLTGQVRGHGVHVVGQILPGAGGARDDGLAAQLPLGADLARHARHLRGERAQLIDHRVDRLLQLEDLAAHVDGDLLRQIAAGDGDGHVGDAAHLRRQVAGHLVDRLGEILPDARDALDLRLAAQLPFGADLARHARDLRREDRELIDHLVHQARRAQELPLQRPAVDVERHRLREIALGHRAHGARHLGRRPDQVVDQRVERADVVRPSAHRPRNVHALLELPFLADHAADTHRLRGAARADRQDAVEDVGDLPLDAQDVRRHAGAEIAVPIAEQRGQQLLRERFADSPLPRPTRPLGKIRLSDLGPFLFNLTITRCTP